MRSWTARGSLLGAVALIAACGNGEEQETLRDALSRLPQDTTPTPAESVAAAASLPVDTALLRFDTSPSVEDTAPLAVAVVEPNGPESGIDGEEAGGVNAEPMDTSASPLRPGPPQDVEPWIPERRSLTVSDEWRETAVDGAGRVEGIATLESVRAARNDEFDRLALEFRGGALPGYRVEYVDPPVRQCGSGQTVPLRGEAWLRIRLEPARAHDERGRATVSDRSRQTDLPSLREMQLICDYEGQVEWILGLNDRKRFRVTELRNPSRLVVDVMH